MAQIWSVYDRENRLVLGLSDEPGIFNFAKPPADDVDPVECHFATLQCYDIRIETALLTILDRCDDLDDFLQALIDASYSVINGQPRPGKFARL
jgi:hypothetical protein